MIVCWKISISRNQVGGITQVTLTGILNDADCDVRNLLRYYHTYISYASTEYCSSFTKNTKMIALLSIFSSKIHAEFWSVFPHIWTEYGNLQCKSPFSVRIQEKMRLKFKAVKMQTHFIIFIFFCFFFC